MKLFGCGLCLVAVAAFFCFSAVRCLRSTNRLGLMNAPLKNVNTVVQMFPKTPSEVEKLAKAAQESAKKKIDEVIATARAERVFDNTFGAVDAIDRIVGQANSAISTLRYLTTDDAMREKCQEKCLEIGNFVVDTLSTKEVFKVLNEYNQDRLAGKVSERKLSDEEDYFIDMQLKQLKAQGMELPNDEFEQFKVLSKESMELSMKFSKNYNGDNTKVEFSESELEGVSADFLAGLEKTDDGKFIVGVDYPSVDEIGNNCSVSETRRRHHEAFNARAWPENDKILADLIKVRAQKAKLLGHKTYAHKDMNLMMVEKPERVSAFLDKMMVMAKPKLEKELKLLTEHLPDGVELDEDGRLKLWDIKFVKESYKKNHLDLDENKVKEYFPLDKTIDGLFKIYQDLLGLEFVFHDNVDLWHKEAKIIEVRDRAKDRTQGFVAIDLHPRPNKYPHACEIPTISTLQRPDGFYPSMCTVVANLPRATSGKPALLKFNDASTFFHEFGHAMHQVLGTTLMNDFSGTGVLRDFVETPSMMFEEWLREPEVLKKLTSHYETGQPMPDDMIEKLVNNRKFDSGYFVARQLGLARYSLDCYSDPDGQPDLVKLWSVMGEAVPGVNTSSLSKSHAAWGHLTGYASKYYTYMWSLVFACDCFEKAKELGLETPEAGAKIKMLLSKGGSLRPEKLLEDLLDRAPTMDAFGKRWGLK